MPRYVALLRGINSGRNPTVRMDDLRRAVEALGFRDVATVLASGNVLFDAPAAERRALERRLERALSPALRFDVAAIVRTIAGIERLVRADPFKGVPATARNGLRVTFLKEPPRRRIAFPVQGPGYTILGITDGAVCSVVDLPSASTSDLMRVLDREFGTAITTRTWNTVTKLLGGR